MNSKRCSMAIAASLAAFLAAGCQDDEISRYQVSRQAPAEVPAAGAKVRMIAAIFPRQDSMWFVKLTGPVPDVEAAAINVASFVKSVRFPEGQPIAWTVPEGWRQNTKPHPVHYATFALATGDKPLEVSVTKLPPQSVLANVNRWRGQLGLPQVSEEDMDKVCKKLEVAGAPAYVMDMIGRQKGTGMPPFAGGQLPPGHPPMKQRPQPEPAGNAPKYTQPKEWTKAPNTVFSILAFQVAEADQKAIITVTPLAGPAGGMSANVNRWRANDLGLPPVGQDEALKGVEAIEVDGTGGQYLDLTNPNTGKRMLVVVVKRASVTWFIKMVGPSELVGKQKDAFMAFVKSLKLPAGAGGNDE